jgi:hypothetical protein
MTPLELPKDVVADPRHGALVALLAGAAGPLWEESELAVATLPPSDGLLADLRAALGMGQACQGLELVADKLAAEKRGLDAASAKPGAQAHAPRVSRVLFVAADGSKRFYRDVEALVRKHATRLLVVRLDVGGELLGEALLGEKRLVRAVLVQDKRACAKALLALLQPG